MATSAREVNQGQSIAAPTGEVELRQARNVPPGTRMGFIVTSGAMQVTVAPKGSQDVIASHIAAFGNTVDPIYMAVDPGDGGSPDPVQRNMFIKGSGTIAVFWERG